jgi:hypothetical protein
MNRARREHEDAPQPMQVPVMREVRHLVFMRNAVQALLDGFRSVTFILPDRAEAHIFQLDAEHAKKLGEELLAPSVEVARPGDVPPAPTNGGPA